MLGLVPELGCRRNSPTARHGEKSGIGRRGVSGQERQWWRAGGKVELGGKQEGRRQIWKPNRKVWIGFQGPEQCQESMALLIGCSANCFQIGSHRRLPLYVVGNRLKSRKVLPGAEKTKGKNVNFLFYSSFVCVIEFNYC